MQSLVQKKFLFGKRIIQFDEKQVVFVIQRLFHREEFRAELADMYVHPVRLLHFPFISLVCAGVFLTVTVVMGLVCAGNLFTAAGAYAALFGFCSFLFFLGTLANAIQKRQDSVIFDVGDFQIILWNNKPSKNTFEAFVHSLQSAIQNAKEEKNNRAISAIKKLHDDGIINEWQYNEALAIITKEESARNMPREK